MAINRKICALAILMSMPLMAQAETPAGGIQAPDIAQLQVQVKEGEPAAMTELGKAYAEGTGVERNVQKAFMLFQQAAGREYQYPQAQLEMARAYMNGMGTDANLISAWIWSKLASYNDVVRDQATTLNQSVAGRLNDMQLEKARELAEQVRTVYLGAGA
ncbi:hypothetical protein ACWJJH_15545 [Endozoicomonadaceae bacterium StTr2]